MAGLDLVLAMSNRVYSNQLKIFLEDAGHRVIEEVFDGNDCLRILYNVNPDLLIVDYELAPSTGYNIARIVDEDRICGGLLILTDAQKDFVQNDFDLINFAYVTKPLNKHVMLSAIEIVNKNSKHIIKLEKKLDKMKETLETRKEVEKAKGILMDIHKISEADAFRRMQKQSMDTGTPLKDIAKAIIIAYKI